LSDVEIWNAEKYFNNNFQTFSSSSDSLPRFCLEPKKLFHLPPLVFSIVFPSSLCYTLNIILLLLSFFASSPAISPITATPTSLILLILWFMHKPLRKFQFVRERASARYSAGDRNGAVINFIIQIKYSTKRLISQWHSFHLEDKFFFFASLLLLLLRFRLRLSQVSTS
jgi:small-conductance mechanosensitive channel